METTEKRPKDMTPEELAALPEANDFDAIWLSPFGLCSDDLLGFRQDKTGKWWRDPPMFA